MQSVIKNPECRRWLVVAILFCLVVGVIVWCCWPREYSPADPRRYVALEKIPFENGKADILLVNPVRWDYSALKKYGITHSQHPNPSYPVDEETWRVWSNSYIVDFLHRVATGKPALIRAIYHPLEAVYEIRYTPSSDSEGTFTSAAYRFGYSEPCNFETGIVDFILCYDSTDGKPAWYDLVFQLRLSGNDNINSFFVQYIHGYDIEHDMLIHSLVHKLESKGFIQIRQSALSHP